MTSHQGRILRSIRWVSRAACGYVVPLLAGILLVAGMQREVGAAPITFKFSGKIQGLTQSRLDSSVSLGTAFAGTYTFEASARNESPLPESGVYRYPVLAPAGMTMTVQIGNYVFSTDPLLDPAPYAATSEIFVLDGALSTSSPNRDDEYYVRSRVSQKGGPQLGLVGNMSIYLFGASPGAVAGNRLPVIPPDLTLFKSLISDFGLQIDNQSVFNGTITSITLSGAVPGVITTVAGNGSQGFSGDGGRATSALLSGPIGVFVDGSGTFYFAEQNNNRIRKVDASGIITTVAGNGTYGYSGDGGPATSASLSSPTGVVVDGLGNLYIADHYNNRIRKVSSTGVITTVAGNGTAGFSGDGGPATSASLNSVFGVVLDGSGSLYIADQNNHRIRKVSSPGVVTTVAGNGTAGFFGDGGPATSASLNYPTGVAVDSSGNLYISDMFNHRIRKVSSTGVITTVAGNGTLGFTGDGGPAISTRLFYPMSVFAGGSGDLYIADRGNHRIRKVSSSGVITTVAGNGEQRFSGDGGPATSTSLNSPTDVFVDGYGNLYISDQGNSRIRKVSGTSSQAYVQSSSSLAFGNIKVGLSGAQTFTVSNPGTAPLTVSGIRVTGADSGQFTPTPASFTIDVGGSSQTVTVRFRPSSSGPKSASLSVTHNAPGSPAVVTLTGQGVQPVMSLLPSDTLRFGEIQVGQGRSLTLKVSNAGNDTLLVSGVVSTDTTFSAEPKSFSVLAGQGRDVVVTFSPLSTGAKSASLSLSHNGAGGSSKIGLSGTATGPLPAPGVQVSAGKATVIRGSTVTVPISVSDAKGIAGGDFTLAYDAAALTAKQVKPESLLVSSGITLIPNLTAAGQVKMSMAGATGITSGSGTLMIVTFEARADAKEGVYPLALQTLLRDGAGGVIPSTPVSGSVTVVVGLFGDVNGDNLVDSGDAVLVLRYSAGLVPPVLTDAQKNLGDVNGDQLVDAGDAILILQKSAGLRSKFPREGAGKTIVMSMEEGSGGPDVRFGEVRGLLPPSLSLGTPLPYNGRGVEGSSLLKVPLVLNAGVGGGDLTLTYDAAVHGHVEVKGSEGVLVVTNPTRSGEVRLSLARADAAEPVTLWVALTPVRGSRPASLSLSTTLPYDGRGGGGEGLPHILRLTGQAFGADGGSLGEVDRIVNRPVSASLSVAYPNPFNPSTTLQYEVGEAGEVRLTVYSLTGQVVRRLASGGQGAGRYTVVWDGRDDAGRLVASGLYLSRLDVGTFHQMQRMMMVK